MFHQAAFPSPLRPAQAMGGDSPKVADVKSKSRAMVPVRSIVVVPLLVGLVASLSGCGASLTDMSGTALPPMDMAGGVAAAGADQAAAGPLQGAQVADKYVSVSKPGSAAYKIGPQDVIEISVFKVPELSKTIQVADTGTINLPLVGEIPAAGLTAQEVEMDLTKRLGAKYLQNPQVTVYVKEFNSQRVTVEGAVKKPGVFPLRGQNSLLQAIALAEGLDRSSDESVVVFRQTDGKRTAARFDLAQIRSGAAEDPAVQSGDVIVVGSSAFREGFENFIKLLPVTSVFALL